MSLDGPACLACPVALLCTTHSREARYRGDPTLQPVKCPKCRHVYGLLVGPSRTGGRDEEEFLTDRDSVLMADRMLDQDCARTVTMRYCDKCTAIASGNTRPGVPHGHRWMEPVSKEKE